MSEPRSSDLMMVSVGGASPWLDMTPPTFRNVFLPLGILRSGFPWPSGGAMPFFDSTGIGTYALPPPFYSNTG